MKASPVRGLVSKSATLPSTDTKRGVDQVVLTIIIVYSARDASSPRASVRWESRSQSSSKRYTISTVYSAGNASSLRAGVRGESRKTAKW